MKNILVTGAGKGIGFELAKQAAQAGHRVLALSRNVSRLEALSHVQITALSADVGKEQYQGALREWVSVYGSFDVVYNNAGLLLNKPFLEISESELMEVYQTNVFGAFRLIQNVLRLKSRDREMHVVNISSMGGFQGSAKFAGLSAYSSSKGALSILSECLAEELKSEGVKVNAICLGAVQTEMLSEAFPGYEAPVQAGEMASFLLEFGLGMGRVMNGKVIPASVSTP